jgi:hypothetical protein
MMEDPVGELARRVLAVHAELRSVTLALSSILRERQPAEPEMCGAVAISCKPLRGCPTEGHEHPACQDNRGHSGFHDWSVSGWWRTEVYDPWAHRPQVWEVPLPQPPPEGTHFTDQFNQTWVMLANGEAQALDPDDPRPTILSWSTLIGQGKLTEAPDPFAELYGPAGARWGLPGVPCPMVACELYQGHAGPHKRNGEVLGATEWDGSVGNPGVTPQQAAQTPCTCLTPAVHTPDCPRYARTSGEARSWTFGELGWDHVMDAGGRIE